MDVDAIAGVLINTGRPRILEEASPDSCVISTRIAIQVLEYFDVRAEPLAVSVLIFNQAFVNLAGEDFEASWKLPLPDASSVPEDVISLGLGIDVAGIGLGHVVAVWDDSMLDLSLDQIYAPDKGLSLAPHLFGITEQFVRGIERIVYRVDDAVLVYEALPGNTWFAQSPNWGRRDEGKRRAIAGEIIRAVKNDAAGLEGVALRVQGTARTSERRE